MLLHILYIFYCTFKENSMFFMEIYNIYSHILYTTIALSKKNLFLPEGKGYQALVFVSPSGYINLFSKLNYAWLYSITTF